MTSQIESPPTAVAEVLSPRHLRSCLSRFVTGVTVVSYTHDDEPRGATVNSFTAVSLDPPLVLVSLARSARAAGHVGHGPFAINVLRADQIDVAMQFAGRPRAGARVRWQHDGEAPCLADTIATFQCHPWRIYDGGDHVLVVGEVVTADHRPGEPLLFTGGSFAMTGLPLHDAPRMVARDDPSANPWLAHACRLHDAASA
ncbi:MAG: flavin reductase [Streptosporangiales bacterium]|nr:flavin reductase [Streptosporangiales bacterium]